MENRLLAAVANTWYAYDPHGKRVLTETAGTTCELDFYSIGGKKLGIFPCQYDTNGIFSVQTWAVTYNLYFGDKLIRSKGVTVVTDQLGSVRGTANGEVMRYTPYGTERTSTSDGREKWGSYFRDTGTGNDYADQRYKGVGAGAFLSPDPGGIATANLKNPGSWNRYAYVQGDPIDGRDPTGRILISCTDPSGAGIYDGSCDGDGGDDGGGGGNPCGGSYFDPTPDPVCYEPGPVPVPAPAPASAQCDIVLDIGTVGASGQFHTSLYLTTTAPSPGGNPAESIQGLPAAKSGNLHPGKILTGGAWLNAELGYSQKGTALYNFDSEYSNDDLCNLINSISSAFWQYKDDRVTYNIFGPNSNTFIAWVLNTAGVQVPGLVQAVMLTSGLGWFSTMPPNP
jgi:RHS repeat-associated protein